MHRRWNGFNNWAWKEVQESVYGRVRAKSLFCFSEKLSERARSGLKAYSVLYVIFYNEISERVRAER